MYAIIEDSGSQIRVEEGQTLFIDYRGTKAGEEVTFDKVLCFGDDSGTKFGTPTLDGATVTAEVTRTVRGPKLVVQKFRRRKHSRRKTGHRQIYTEVTINKIAAS